MANRCSSAYWRQVSSCRALRARSRSRATSGARCERWKGSIYFPIAAIRSWMASRFLSSFPAGYRVNGDGTLSGVNSFSINGATSQNVTYTGTYTVNPDCTGSSTTVDDVTGETGHLRSILRARWRRSGLRPDRSWICDRRHRTQGTHVGQGLGMMASTRVDFLALIESASKENQ